MITILLVDHALECERSVHSLLLALPLDQFQIERGTGYRTILEGFRSQTADVCVIDSYAGNELKLLAQARSVGLSMPIIVVTANDASEVVTAIRNGAADCLVRDQVTPAIIERSLCCVVEQSRSAALQSARERRYLALFDNLDEIVYTHNLDSHITSMNAAGLHLLGYSLPEILGLKVSAIVETASQPLVSSTTDLLLDAQTRTRSEVRLATKSGQSLTVEMNAHPIYQHGKPVEVQVCARIIARPLMLPAEKSNNSIHSFSAQMPHRFQPEIWPTTVRAF
ncbi:MAG TPA: PAS domain S-box protein [Pyrinomonadaceae bacterium]|nr:PAS domain S-box protein [Pyrinomonadaceae bacterium]